MKKSLIFFAFLASMGIANAAVLCPTQQPTCDPEEILECQTTQGVMPSGDVRGNWICQDPDNWQAPPPAPIDGRQGSDKKEKAPIDPCGGTVAPTITPNPVRSWQSFMARYISQPIIQPQQARPAAAGPTTNSFGTRAGIAEGDDICKWENSPEENEFNACTESLRPKNQFPNWPAIYAKCKELHRAACGSDPVCIKGTATYPAPGKMNCQSKKLSGSVFDALWGFLTHRKPY